MEPQREGVVRSSPVPIEDLTHKVGVLSEEWLILTQSEDGRVFIHSKNSVENRLFLNGFLLALAFVFKNDHKSVKTVEDRNNKTLRIFL